ncbi:MAG: ribosome small subunit-dependent GTPase A [Clostridiales bacterium]|nr:ribosome small subunit-dependent GTPase A [Clostridiales bacterium]
MTLGGIITKGIGGFYYVETTEGLYECKARGSFRKEGITPFVGDKVEISVNLNAENTIDRIQPRVNYLSRPPVANIDNIFIVISTVYPSPNFILIDNIISIAEYRNIEPVIIVSKSDLSDSQDILNTYKKAGFNAFDVNDDDCLEDVKKLMKGKINAFTGNSGVGKSTLLNKLDPSLSLSTAPISMKLGRGKHTTRQAELFKSCGGYVIDTPGFSSFEFTKSEYISKDELAYYFREFVPFLDKCKFSTCAHINDKGCAVLEAMEKGEISPLRHKSYTELYNNVKNIKEWHK